MCNRCASEVSRGCEVQASSGLSEVARCSALRGFGSLESSVWSHRKDPESHYIESRGRIVNI